MNMLIFLNGLALATCAAAFPLSRSLIPTSFILIGDGTREFMLVYTSVHLDTLLLEHDVGRGTIPFSVTDNGQLLQARAS